VQEDVAKLMRYIIMVKKEEYGIVGHCPECGCPIYGKLTLSSEDEDIPIIMSCECECCCE